MKKLGLLLLLAACNPGPAAPPAKFWTAADFLTYQGQDLNFGGFFPDELARAEGAPLRFQPGTQSGGPGLTLFPAVADGAPAAFAITDIWQDHPEPWVQPVWAPFDQNGVRPEGVLNVFPVDVGSTFYSPFWRAELLLTEGLTDSTFRSARDVLSSTKYERRTGPLILCPIVPEGTTFANDGSGPEDPVTLRPLQSLPSKTASAWVDGKQVAYLDFGADRAASNGQDLIEDQAWFFVSAAGERPLPLAAILPSDPKRHSFVRRVDVVLPAGSAAFVPSNRPDLRALLLARDLTVPDVAPALDAFPQFALRVAANPACFEDANFPAACDWLDSPARIAQLSSTIVQPVQLAIGAVTE